MAVEPRQISAAATSCESRPRMLVIDDNESILTSARMYLEDRGLDVEVSLGGHEIFRRLSSVERFDLVLCDVAMPTLSGWEIAEFIRKSMPSAKIFMLTGWDEDMCRAEPRRRLVDGVLFKPFEIDELDRIIENILQCHPDNSRPFLPNCREGGKR